MEQNQNKEGFEANLVQAQRDRIKFLLKTAGWTALPVAVLGGLVTLGQLVGSQFESQDLGTLIEYGIPFGAGTVIGASGVMQDYLDQFRDFVDDVRYASSRIREYKTQLRELE